MFLVKVMLIGLVVELTFSLAAVFYNMLCWHFSGEMDEQATEQIVAIYCGCKRFHLLSFSYRNNHAVIKLPCCILLLSL